MFSDTSKSVTHVSPARQQALADQYVCGGGSVRVKSVHRVVLRGGKHNVVRSAADGQVPQPTEAARTQRHRWTRNVTTKKVGALAFEVFRRVIPRLVVVISKHPIEISDSGAQRLSSPRRFAHPPCVCPAMTAGYLPTSGNDRSDGSCRRNRIHFPSDRGCCQ